MQQWAQKKGPFKKREGVGGFLRCFIVHPAKQRTSNGQREHRTAVRLNLPFRY